MSDLSDTAALSRMVITEIMESGSAAHSSAAKLERDQILKVLTHCTAMLHGTVCYIATQAGRETDDLWAYFCAVQASTLEAGS